MFDSELILLVFFYFFFFYPRVSKNLVAVRFCEFGTEHSDVNLQPVWF